MSNKDFKVMDSDMHVLEPVDLWERLTRSSRTEPLRGCYVRPSMSR